MSVRVRKELVCDRCGYSLHELAPQSYDRYRADIKTQRAVAKRFKWRKCGSGEMAMDYCNGCWPDVFGRALASR